MINKDILIQAFFQDNDFEQTWMDIKQEYEVLGFHDDIDDKTMIDEFKYIAQQLRKYKFSKQDQILKHDSYEDMVNEVGNLIGKASEYESERKQLVYGFLRDHWLVNMYNTLIRIVAMENSSDEEDNDA